MLGQAVTAHAEQGEGAARIAAALGRPVRTVAGWLAQARVFAARHLPAFTAMLRSFGGGDDVPVVPGSDLVMELLGVLRTISVNAASRWGDPCGGEWERIGLICRGRFMSASLPVPFYPGLAYPGMT